MNMKWHSVQPLESIYASLKTSAQGLTATQVHKRTKKTNLSLITRIKNIFWKLLVDQFASPFTILLCVIALTNYILDSKPEAVLILIIIAVNSLLGLYQEYKAQQALQSLKNYLPDSIHVIRDAQEIELTTDKLVIGDIIKLYPGDTLPATIRFIATDNLLIDESSFMGQPTSTKKISDSLLHEPFTTAEALNIGFKDTTVKQGTGVGVVFSLESSTHKTEKKNTKASALTQQITNFSRLISYIMVGTIILVFLLHFLGKNEDIDLIYLLIFSVALGINVVPEALPMVITLALARGVLTLARDKVIVKRLSAIEDLGSMQILCVDNTGMGKEWQETELLELSHVENAGIIVKKIAQNSLPEQKVEIINDLKENYVVGYIDGSMENISALRAAHVSLVASTAVDNVREAADIILLQKNFRILVDGVHEGRIIFANIAKYIKATLTANFGHLYSLALASIIFHFSPIRPSQLLAVSLLADLPLIALSTDNVSRQDIKKPQKYDLRWMIIIAAILALVVMLADLSLFLIFFGKPAESLQTTWFITSILIELGILYSLRTKDIFFKAPRPSLPLIALSLFAAVAAFVLPYTFVGQTLLYFKPLSWSEIKIIATISIAGFLITDILKKWLYRVYSQTI